MTEVKNREYAYVATSKKYAVFMRFYIIIYMLFLIVLYYTNFIFDFFINISYFFIFTLFLSMLLFVALLLRSEERKSALFKSLISMRDGFLVNPVTSFLFMVFMFLLAPFFITLDEKIIQFSGGIFYPFIVAASQALSLVLLPEMVIGMRGVFSLGNDKT